MFHLNYNVSKHVFGKTDPIKNIGTKQKIGLTENHHEDKPRTVQRNSRLNISIKFKESKNNSNIGKIG